MIAYKMFRQRKDGTLCPLFINASQRVPVGEWLEAEDHPTKGFAHRPGWHATLEPHAPWIKKSEGRVWCKVRVQKHQVFPTHSHFEVPLVLARRMKVLEVIG